MSPVPHIQNCSFECTRQIALERQDLSRTYLAHHKLESIVVIIIVIIIKAAAVCLLASYQYRCPCEHDYTDSSRHILETQDANHTSAHVPICVPVQAKGCWAARYNTGLLIKLTPKGVVLSFLFYKQKAACTMAGVAQDSVQLSVKFYLALLLA